ncbi:sensor histidine kinase [Neobacillus dielmonensis]|uniref:sensor histidine kinase n=1 Tax=Neobacillus dielmonensis TaxID=1347369 RepID=UPI0005A684BE|nr:sensor histidine kinase [Neobacillus dielmonensis]
MMKEYLKERRSWILLIVSLELLIVLVSYLDATIPFMPILYIVFLSAIIFVLFFIVRYQKETKFYRSLKDWEKDLDITNLVHGELPFEKIAENTLTRQTEFFKQEANHQFTSLEQEKDEILSWIHEVKTPLTAMSLIIDRLEDQQIKSELRYEWLRIHLLLDQQLHQKRLPFMENDLYIEKTSLQPLIFQELKTLQSWCMQKRIGFDVDLGVPEVLTDAKWLGFILRQLITNAVKYSKDTDIVIKSYQKDGHTCLDVTDCGRGIDPKDLPRIFEKGFTSTAKHQDRAATGMGLYLAKKAAKPLLLKFNVSSQLGKGTTFTLTFPKRNEFVHITGV